MRKPPIKSSIIYHIYNRGVSKRVIFKNRGDYLFFLAKINSSKTQYSIKIISYCLMPNHYHLLLYTEKDPENIPKFMKVIQQSFALHYNGIYRHAGHVFQGSYKNKIVGNPIYLHKIIDYIAQNPVRRGFVKSAEEWEFSG